MKGGGAPGVAFSSFSIVHPLHNFTQKQVYFILEDDP
jgi:hypothetical protein